MKNGYLSENADLTSMNGEKMGCEWGHNGMYNQESDTGLVRKWGIPQVMAIFHGEDDEARENIGLGYHIFKQSHNLSPKMSKRCEVSLI